MFVKYTEAEQQELNRLYDQQRVIFDNDHDATAKLLEEYPQPDTDYLFIGLDPEKDPTAWEKAREAENAAMDDWEKNKPPAWARAYKEQQERLNNRLQSIGEQLGQIRTAAINRHFKALESNPAAILTDAKDQAERRVSALIREYEATEKREGIQGFSGEALVSLGNGVWKLNADDLCSLIKNDLQRHYELLEDHSDFTGKLSDQLDSYIETYLQNNPYVTTEKSIEPMVKVSRELIRTQYPVTLATPADKVSKKLFAGALAEYLQPVGMERKKSRKPIDTLASITFPQMQSVKGMTWYDSSVYNAICALYIRGKNEYVTLQMIYQAMTADDNARLSANQAQKISESITRFRYGGVFIDASEEISKHHIDGKAKYDDNLLHAERVRVNLNGTYTEAYHILKTPVLYEYANSKGQIANPPIKALASPLNKNEDNLALQTYLIDRIWGMKGGAIERDIAYNTIYNAVWGKEASSKARGQKARLRSSAFKILEHWKKPESGNLQIKGFTEYIRGKTAQGIRIDP